MTISNHAFVRQTIEEGPPRATSAVGVTHWLRTPNSSPRPGCGTHRPCHRPARLYFAADHRWLFIDAYGRAATVSPASHRFTGRRAAGWTVRRLLGFRFGQARPVRLWPLPIDERWRPILVMVMFTILLIPIAHSEGTVQASQCAGALHHPCLHCVFSCISAASFWPAEGGNAQLWGGLMVTLICPSSGSRCRCPSAFFWRLADVRTCRSSDALRPLHRGHQRHPLITVLFFASIMLPLFPADGWTFDKFLRALVGVSLFYSAYMAEVIRGGLQAHSEGTI